MRMEKVNSQIKRKITEIIQEEIDDPGLGIVSITRVDTTADLKESKVYFSVLDNEFTKVNEIFNKMKGFIRASLGKRIRLKFLPQLKFIPDDSIKYSVEINKKIEEVRSAEKNNRDNNQQ